MKLTRILGILGGLIWVCAGTVLALRPANVSGVSFRASMDVLPWLGLGLLLIAAMLFGLNYQQQKHSGKLGQWSSLGIVAGAFLYTLGHVVRQFLNGGWEPAVPLGFLTFILSLILLAIATRRAKVFPKQIAYALLFAAICLLFFNDQFVTAWFALPFGLMCIVLGVVIKPNAAVS